VCIAREREREREREATPHVACLDRRQMMVVALAGKIHIGPFLYRKCRSLDDRSNSLPKKKV
jgi:hypothetical protein